jgi:hypothetical protein
VGGPVPSRKQRDEIAPDLVLAGSRLAELCMNWLSCVPKGTRQDFDERLKKWFGLVPVPEEVFDREAGIAEPGAAPDRGGM